ncbi:MAG TPA: hypothetical protein ENF66_00340 [Firmicutes bacterium]|nr:hypothetical protein [Bacillota bacterium]
MAQINLEIIENAEKVGRIVENIQNSNFAVFLEEVNPNKVIPRKISRPDNCVLAQEVKLKTGLGEKETIQALNFLVKRGKLDITLKKGYIWYVVCGK